MQCDEVEMTTDAGGIVALVDRASEMMLIYALFQVWVHLKATGRGASKQR